MLRECRPQISTMIDAGIKLSHLDGHRDAFSIPNLHRKMQLRAPGRVGKRHSVGIALASARLRYFTFAFVSKKAHGARDQGCGILKGKVITVQRFRWVLFFPLVLLVFATAISAQGAKLKTKKKGRLLYMTMTVGYRHTSIELSKQILQELAAQSGAFDVTLTEDVAAFTKENLKKYDAVMFYTTGELPMTSEEKGALTDFIKSGHGFVGVHGASDTFYQWDTYNDILGGYFNGHPWHESVTIDVTDPESEIVGFLGQSFQINDEIYQISDFKASTSHVLLSLHPQTGDMKREGLRVRYYGWPLAWTRKFGKGRVYYNALGYEEAVWKDPRFQEMLLNGIKWVM